MELKDRVALITGGAQGIGKIVGEELARQGAHVILGDVNLEGADKSAGEIRKNGGSASAVELNVTDAGGVQKCFDSVSKEFKLVDILVNNAGITRDGLLMRMKEADWDLVLSINLKGSFLCSQQAVKQMMKQKSGSIVNVASIVGLMGNAGQANYSASKAGLIGLTKTTAREVASRGIRVNAIAPGFIDTAMTQVLDEKSSRTTHRANPAGSTGSTRRYCQLCFVSCFGSGQLHNRPGS